ncbi:MAG: MarR family transcriptional regulator [Stellaceae bacterium]
MFEAFRAPRTNRADARLFAILALIGSSPHITQGSMAAALHLQISTMTPALNELVRRG